MNILKLFIYATIIIGISTAQTVLSQNVKKHHILIFDKETASISHIPNEWSVITNQETFSYRYKSWRSSKRFSTQMEALHAMNELKLLFEVVEESSKWEDVD